MPVFFHTQYQSILGNLHLLSDETGITDIIFDERFDEFAKANLIIDSSNEFLLSTCKYLDIYFSGNKPDFIPKLHLIGTKFQLDVWNYLLTIEYSKSCSYSQIASFLECKYGIAKMSCKAVGQAVSKNRIPIIVPCHRVIGKNGKLVGYSGGTDRKISLLNLEHIPFLL